MQPINKCRWTSPAVLNDKTGYIGVSHTTVELQAAFFDPSSIQLDRPLSTEKWEGDQAAVKLSLLPIIVLPNRDPLPLKSAE